MKTTSLVTLDCQTGAVKRWLRIAGNKPVETGRTRIADWDPAIVDEPGVGEKLIGWLQVFRTAWTPPEDPGPRPTSPMRTAIAA